MRQISPAEPHSSDHLSVANGKVESTDPRIFVSQLEKFPQFWFTLEMTDGLNAAERLAPLVSNVLESEQESILLAGELVERYEEINLVYSIAETLGRTVSLAEACDTIVREVSSVVGSRRGSIMVYDEPDQLLRLVAGSGIDVAGFEPIHISDENSVAARAFRERRIISYEPATDQAEDRPYPSVRQQPYEGSAFLCVPIMYPGPDSVPRPVGVINLTDRQGADSFRVGQQRLMAAVANQIGAAIQNARLVERDLARQRLNQELQLARELQNKLLPEIYLHGDGYEFAARSEPSEIAGGDFYKFFALPEGKMGVVMGDVSSHGFSAALMMALVLSAVGIHGEGAASPDEAIRRLLASVSSELDSVDMYFSIFYGVVDPANQRLTYANAGHPHAFLVSKGIEPVRIGASAPPLGLSDASDLVSEEIGWTPGGHSVVLFSDGLVDTTDDKGNAFGESAVLDLIQASVDEDSSAMGIVDTTFGALARFAAAASDDQTLVILKG